MMAFHEYFIRMASLEMDIKSPEGAQYIRIGRSPIVWQRNVLQALKGRNIPTVRIIGQPQGIAPT
jgi:hypothetical protein